MRSGSLFRCIRGSPGRRRLAVQARQSKPDLTALSPLVPRGRTSSWRRSRRREASQTGASVGRENDAGDSALTAKSAACSAIPLSL